jgi:hypothetical protein
MATESDRSCAISVLVGSFHRKRRHQTSPDLFGVNADVIDYLEYYTKYPKTTNVRNVIIESAPQEHAGKGADNQ